MPEQIQSPSMTAEWEQKLLDVEKGAFRDAEFMNEIEGMITELVRTYKIIEDAEVLMHGNADIQLYETMQFMGRYSVWEKLFPNVFNGKLRKHIFGSNPWMIDMYEFLIKHQDIESANKNYDQMFGIIKENFGGF